MNGMSRRWLISAACAFLICTGQRTAGQPVQDPVQTAAMPRPADVKSLDVFPAEVTLKGIGDSRQLIVIANLVDRRQDLTGEVTYQAADPAVVRVTTSGRILTLANGVTAVKIQYGDKTVSVPVSSTDCDVNLPINFSNQIVPIFTKLGCNSGGCHGKSGGQQGFALSLLGFIPQMDFAALVKEARGRRLFPASPDNSLLLLKAAGQVPHGGGKRMELDSDEYKLIKRWIAAGTPFGSAADPVVTRISIFPDRQILTRKNHQQFAVLAHYSDGSVIDVTQSAQYESNDQDIAIVDGAGLVRTLDLGGEAGIMARYQGHVAVFRATVPLGVAVPDYLFEEKTVVDKHTRAKWKELGLVPSEMCSDEQFLRRIMLDVTGTLPTPDQVRSFMADANPSKRDALIDRLLETPEYAYLFANKWADILRVKRRGQPGRAFGTFAFHDWIQDAIAKDKPYRRVCPRNPGGGRRRRPNVRRRSGIAR